VSEPRKQIISGIIPSAEIRCTILGILSCIIIRLLFSRDTRRAAVYPENYRKFHSRTRNKKNHPLINPRPLREAARVNSAKQTRRLHGAAVSLVAQVSTPRIDFFWINDVRRRGIESVSLEEIDRPSHHLSSQPVTTFIEPPGRDGGAGARRDGGGTRRGTRNSGHVLGRR